MALPSSGTGSTPEGSEDKLHRTLRRKVAWRLVPLLAFAYFMAQLERTNLGVASLSMNNSLGLTAAAFGLAAGLYFVGYFFFEVPSNVAMVRFGARRWLTRIALTWGVVAVLTAAVQGPVSLYVMRILLGVAEAGLFPGVVFYFTLWFPARDRAKMLALFTVGSSVAGIVGPPLSGAILQFWPGGLFGLEDWRALFIVEGLPSILVGVLIWRLLADTPEGATWLTGDEKDWIARRVEAPHAHDGRGLLTTMADPRVLLLSAAYFAKNCGGYVLIFFMPTIIKSLNAANGTNYSTFTIALLTAVPAVFTVVTAIAWAASSDRRQERRWHSVIPLLIAAAGIAWAASTTAPVPLLIALTLATAGIGSMSGAFFQIPAGFLAGPSVAVGIAAINATGNLGGFVGPYLFGVLQDSTGSFTTGNLILAGVLVAGALLILLPSLRPVERAQEQGSASEAVTP